MKRVLMSLIFVSVLIGLIGIVSAENSNCTLQEDKCCMGENCSEIKEVVCAPGYEQEVQSCDEFCNTVAPCIDDSGNIQEDDGCTKYYQCSNGNRIKKCELEDGSCTCRGISSSECSQNVCDSDNLNLCLNKVNCETAGGDWEEGACIADDEDDEDDDDENETEDNETDDDSDNFGLGQIIRNRVHAGVYTSESGEQIRVRELAQNRYELLYNNDTIGAETELEVEEETENNKTKLKVKLSNGRNAEIKIMPETASERALERLRLKVCNSENNCTIELKEVGKGNSAELKYEIQIQRHSKILGIFQKKMQVRAEVDAEDGEVKTDKPWWAFIATEPEE